MKISVVGLGKLGLPIFEVFKEKFDVIGIDKEKKDGFTTSFSDLGDISFVVVPTPSLPNYKFSSAYVDSALLDMSWKENHHVAIVSTVMPGETDRLQKKYPMLHIAYNPTFVALGSVKYDFRNPYVVLMGSHDKDFQHILLNIHDKILEKLNPTYFAYLTPLEAEIAKLSLNCYVTQKITFANQIGNLCHRLGIKAEDILAAIGHDVRIGNSYFKAGLGYGGPCFPRDNLAMSAFMIDNEYDPALFRTVHQLNKKQTDEILERICDKQPSSVGFSGLSYKENSDVTEHSQLKEIHDMLKERGYKTVIGGEGQVNLDWGGIK